MKLQVCWYDEQTPLSNNSLIVLSQKQYTIHVSLELVKQVPQRVYAPRFKKPKNYSYYVVVMNMKKKILGWKRCSVVKHSTIKIPVLFSSNQNEQITVKVFCDSVVGIEVEMNMNVKVTGNEEELKKLQEGSNFKPIAEYIDDDLDADEFSDSDIELDEYLMDYYVCLHFIKWKVNQKNFLPFNLLSFHLIHILSYNCILIILDVILYRDGFRKNDIAEGKQIYGIIVFIIYFD